jgi:hypothetical protein
VGGSDPWDRFQWPQFRAVNSHCYEQSAGGDQHFIAVLLELQLSDDGRLASNQFTTMFHVTDVGFTLSTCACSSGDIPHSAL